MRIITLKEDEFNAFARKHKYESFYQTTEYANFKNHSENYDIHYLGFTNNNDDLLGATMVIYKELFWGYKFAYAPRGFLIDYTDSYLVNNITTELKNLLHKQKFIFIKIDPPVIVNERDRDGNVIYNSETINQILTILKRNDYEHLGFNLYNESILSRFNIYARLNNNTRALYNSFDKDIKEKIKLGNQSAITLEVDEDLDVDKFYDYIKRAYARQGKRYFKELIDSFSKEDHVKIFYAKLNTNKFTQNANNLYNVELQKNEGLTKIIESGDSYKYDIQRVIDDKMESDRLLNIYKKHVVESTNLLRKYPDGISCGVALVVEQNMGVNVLVNYTNPIYAKYNVNEVMTYEIMKYFSNLNYKYINLGAVTGNFNPKAKFYSSLKNKMGFNSSVIEYIGEFNLIINPLMYKVYKYKEKKKK